MVEEKNIIIRNLLNIVTDGDGVDFMEIFSGYMSDWLINEEGEFADEGRLDHLQDDYMFYERNPSGHGFVELAGFPAHFCHMKNAFSCKYLDFNKIALRPDEYETLPIEPVSIKYCSPDEWKVFENNMHYLFQKYGSHSAADWELANWGCDGYSRIPYSGMYELNEINVDEVYGRDMRDSIVFETHNSSCIPAILRLSILFPGIEFSYKYASTCVGSNTGILTFMSGSIKTCITPHNNTKDAFEIGYDVWGRENNFGPYHTCCVYWT